MKSPGLAEGSSDHTGNSARPVKEELEGRKGEGPRLGPGFSQPLDNGLEKRNWAWRSVSGSNRGILGERQILIVLGGCEQLLEL